MISPLNQGGLKSIDVESQSKGLRLAWLPRLIKKEGWEDVLNHYLKPLGGLELLLRCNYNVEYLSYIPIFYRQMLSYANETFVKPNSKFIIWNNSYVLVENKSLFYKEWYEKGVIYFQNLSNNSGQISG